MPAQLQSSLTLIIPALDEENNLRAVVLNSTHIAKQYFRTCEVIIFNDGSSDLTGEIADELAKTLSDVRVIHHKTPQNLGGCYKEGVALAHGDFIMMVPGDNECGEGVLKAVFSRAGMADIVIPFTANSEVRPLGRRVLSAGFIALLNIISGCRLRYYNGAVLHRTKLIRSYSIETDSFAYQAEALVMLLRRGHSFLEVPTDITYRPTGRSKALRWRNIFGTVQFLMTLAKKIGREPVSGSPLTEHFS